MTIPKIIHQTWKTADVPADWAEYAQSWKSMHPDWAYILWTDEDNRALVAGHYPDLLPRYDAFSYNIQRADAVRYCLLHHFGGVYVDMDIECLRPLDELIESPEFLAVLEPDGQARWLGFDSLVSNAFMASRPGHPFTAALLDTMCRNPNPGLTHRDVLETTGPILVHHLLESYEDTDVSIFPSHVAFPFPSQSLELMTLQARAPGHEALRRRAIDAGAFAVHYWANSWVGTLAGQLINPQPEAIEGFEFMRGLDSPGNDIANLGRDIVKAARACLELSDAVAFNTDGFAKCRLLPRSQWLPMGNGAANEGLYVKKPRGLSRLLPGWRRLR